jgi:hypothetical protein
MLYLNEEAVTPTQVLQHWLLQHVDADPTGEGLVWGWDYGEGRGQGAQGPNAQQLHHSLGQCDCVA